MDKKTSVQIFESDNGTLEVKVYEETVWLVQSQMAELFGTSTDNVSLHIKNIYTDEELDEFSTTKEFSVVRQEGKRKVNRTLKHYNLDMIISVGYRVNSKRGVKFRQWASGLLKEYLLKGYVLDTERLESNAQELTR
ncbi:virulence RhuM family protein [Vibrio anguillarum]|uniref:virulence RhuM family protein n=1 Tax=Vibrio anguillarum TaxID=55601 RepID=UPI00188A6E51|nr:RhuM family protein [Vibrio anguillarum]MBF4302694.1 death-on-curing protein [Vibrio anguillarum]